MLKDVGDRKIVGKDRIDEGKSSAGDGHKAGDSGAASGVGETLGGDAGWLTGCNQPECNGSREKIVGGQNESDKKTKAAKSGHSRGSPIDPKGATA